MAIKKRSESAATKKPAPSPEAVEALANRLADRAYGDDVSTAPPVEPELPPEKPAKPKAKPISISLPPSVVAQLEDVVYDNKKSGDGPRTISAIVREALKAAGYKG
jgi:hypothetical protein